MQPPLYNLMIGLLLQLPQELRAPLAAIVWASCALVISLAAFGTMVRLGVSRRVALLSVLILVTLNPSNILFANWLTYAIPTAALVSAFAYLAITALQRPTTARFAAMSSVGAALCLFNNLFQPALLVIVLGCVLIALRSHWRQILLGAALPLMVVTIWLAHTTVSFGSPVTSTWLGMNLARTTTTPADPRTLQHLVRQGTLTPLALRQPFLPLADYGITETSGSAALHQPTKSDGTPNFNDRAYINLSRRFLSDDLGFIATRPSDYLHRVAQSESIWLVPADQYFTVLEMQRGLIGAYTHLYDHAVALQPVADPHVSGVALLFHRGPHLSSLSWCEVLLGGINLVGTPVLIAVWWKRRRPEALSVAIMGMIVGEWWISSTLIEYGENNRFRLELGPLPIILGAVILSAALRHHRVHRHAPEVM